MNNVLRIKRKVQVRIPLGHIDVIIPANATPEVRDQVIVATFEDLLEHGYFEITDSKYTEDA